MLLGLRARTLALVATTSLPTSLWFSTLTALSPLRSASFWSLFPADYIDVSVHVCECLCTVHVLCMYNILCYHRLPLSIVLLSTVLFSCVYLVLPSVAAVTSWSSSPSVHIWCSLHLCYSEHLLHPALYLPLIQQSLHATTEDDGFVAPSANPFAQSLNILH